MAKQIKKKSPAGRIEARQPALRQGCTALRWWGNQSRKVEFITIV